jgi:hypothetical protein
MRTLLAVMVCLAIVVRPVGAQDRSARLTLVVVPGDTGRAIVSALEYLQKITPDSILLSGCRFTTSDSSTVRTVTVGSSQIQLPGVGDRAGSFCKPRAVRQPDGVLVFVEGLRQIEKDVVLPYWERINFEITIQIQYGMSHREWHTLIVRPNGGAPKDTGLEARAWRVSKWEITRWQSH